jgi:hypothetical protein
MIVVGRGPQPADAVRSQPTDAVNRHGEREGYREMQADRASVVVRVLSCTGVQPDDLVGTWVMTETSRGRLSGDLRKAMPRIVLDASGSFVASDLPALFDAQEPAILKSESGSGVWKLVSRDGQQDLQLEFQTRANEQATGSVGRRFHVSGGSLFYFIGDPDEGRRVSFEKKSRQPVRARHSILVGRSTTSRADVTLAHAGGSSIPLVDALGVPLNWPTPPARCSHIIRMSPMDRRECRDIERKCCAIHRPRKRS